MPPKGLFINIPMRVRVDYLDLVGDITLDPIEIGPVVIPSPVPVPPPTPAVQFTLHDVIGMLPTKPSNRTDNLPVLKSSLTFHWEGDAVIPPMTVDETASWLQGVAQYHINKDWGSGAYGDGIMYHEAIGQNGDSYLLRSYTDVLWHCADYDGNRTSRAFLVICSARTPVNPVQLQAVRRRIAAFRANAGSNVPAYPHRKWVATACPGDTITEFLGTQ